MPKSRRLRKSFFDRSVHEVAPDLIGATFLFHGVGGIIVEVEAYHHTDPAAHSFGGQTQRNAVCSARRAMRTSIVPMASTGASISSARAPARRARCCCVRSSRPKGLPRCDGGGAPPIRACSAPARGGSPKRSASRLRRTGSRSTRRRSNCARVRRSRHRCRPAHRDHQGGGTAVALRPERLAFLSKPFRA